MIKFIKKYNKKIIISVSCIIFFSIVILSCIIKKSRTERKELFIFKDSESISVSVESNKEQVENTSNNLENNEKSTEKGTEINSDENSKYKIEAPAILNDNITHAASPSASGKLHLEGTELTDSKGNKVQLRGVSTHGIAWFPEYVNQKFFLELKNDWNANVVRIAMYTSENGGYCSGGDKEKLKKIVKDGVRYATNADMYVIVDWHVLQEGNPHTYLSEAKAFFNEISKEYSGANNVLYEICNEPNGVISWNDVKAYAEEIIPVIRANDKDAIIIVGTPTWSQDIDKAADNMIKGYDNIMYALHFYASTHTDWLRERMISAKNAGLPIFVTEYGTCDANGNGGIDYIQSDEWIRVMDSNNISHVAWNLSNKNETSAIFKSGCNKVSGFNIEDLTDNGKWIYKMLTGKTTLQSQENNQQENSQQENNQQENGQQENVQQNVSDNQQITTLDLKYTARITNSWEADGKKFYQYIIDIENTSGKDVEAWEVSVNFNEDVTFSDGWNGEYVISDKIIKINSKDYNGKILNGGKIDNIGFIVSGSAGLKVVS